MHIISYFSYPGYVCTCVYIHVHVNLFLLSRLWMHGQYGNRACCIQDTLLSLQTQHWPSTMSLIKDVQQWDNVAHWIGIPLSKLSELVSRNPTTDQYKQACWDYWFHHHPAPSWRILAGGLYELVELEALEVLQMNYLKGETIGGSAMVVTFWPIRLLKRDW